MAGPLSDILKRILDRGTAPKQPLEGAQKPAKGDVSGGTPSPSETTPSTDAPAPGDTIKEKGQLRAKAPKGMGERLEETDLNKLATENFEAEADPVLRQRYGVDQPQAEAEPQSLLFNANRIQAEDDINTLFDEVAEAFPEDFAEYTRGVQSLDDIEARSMAAMMNTTTTGVRELQSLKAEDFTRAGFTLINMASEIKKLSTKVASPHGSEADAAALRVLMEDFVTTTMHVKGLQTETARTLSAMRISKKATAEASEQVREVIESFGGMGQTKRIAAMLGSLENPDQIARFIHRAHKMTGVDMLWEAYYASLLSSPQTHFVNALTSFAAYNYRVPEMVVAYGVGKVRSALVGGDAAIYWNEISSFIADVESIKLATSQAWKGLKTGQPSDLTQKLEGRVRQPALTAGNIRDMAPARWMNMIVPDLLKDGHWTQRSFDFMADWTIRGPQRLMVSADEFNKGLAYTSFMRSAATRIANEEGLSGAAHGKRIKELLSNPEQMMPGDQDSALRFAQEMTFQQPLGRMGQGAQRLLTAEPDFESAGANFTMRAIQAPLRMTFPFVKTPVNVFKYAGRRGPLAFAMPSFWQAVAKGGPDADLAVAQLGLGTAVAYGMFELAAGGYLSGAGPLDPGLNKQWRELGFQKYSFTIPKDSAAGEALGLDKDHNISIRRADPFSMIAGVAADMHDIWAYATPDERNLLATALVASVWNNLGNRTFLEGFGELQDALGGLEQGRTQRLQTYFTKMLSSPVVPAGVAWLGRTLDEDERTFRSTRSARGEAPPPRRPGERDIGQDVLDQITSFAEETINRIKARAPGLGSDLPPLVNFFGKEIKGPNGFLFNIAPFYHQDMKVDGAAMEALGLPRTGWTGTPATVLDFDTGDWAKFLKAGGPEGEFIRLGWSPGRHPDRIKGAPLTPAQQHAYIVAVNKIEGPEIPFIFKGEIVADIEGLDLRQALVEVMNSEIYWEASDFAEVEGSKQSMIRVLVGKYRHQFGRDDDLEDNPLKLGGADAVLFETDLDVAQRVTRTFEDRQGLGDL